MLFALYPHHQGSYQDELTLTATQVRDSNMYCTYAHCTCICTPNLIEVTGNS